PTRWEAGRTSPCNPALNRRHRASGCEPAARRPMSPVLDKAQSEYLVRPDPGDPRLTERVRGIDHTGAPAETAVTVERALTIFLNAQEIVTATTNGDYHQYLAHRYELNDDVHRPHHGVTGVDDDDD